MKKLFVLSTAILFSFGLSGAAFAFHGGGVAHCDGCHSMHNSADNARNVGTTGASLMKGSDASSTCLNCHNGAGRYHVASADGSNKNEGGDFHWTQDHGYLGHDTDHNGELDAVWTTAETSNFGHNIVAADFNMVADANVSAAPGGSYLAANLGCSSCHDPHGQAQGGTIGGAAPISVSGSYGDVPATGTIAGNYRLLFDSNQVGFNNDAPIARANSYDGKSTQYGSGMSGWCANCHGGFYANSASAMHPTDVAVPATYSSYIATGNFTGDGTTSYDPLVPIERGVTTASSDLPDPTDAVAAAVGADGSSKVMCLSCHRAHASAFENALRWDGGTEFIAESWTAHGCVPGWLPPRLPTTSTVWSLTSPTPVPGIPSPTVTASTSAPCATSATCRINLLNPMQTMILC